MKLIILWVIFIIFMVLGASGRPMIDPKIDTYHYFLYGINMLYLTYIYNQIK